jgi:hypothetical protein
VVVVIILFLDPGVREGLFGSPKPFLVKVELAGVAHMPLEIMLVR